VSLYNRDVVCRLSHRVALPLTMIMALFSTFPMRHQRWECEYPYSIHRQLILMLDLLSVGCEYVYANTTIKKLLRPCPSHLSSSYSCLILILFFSVEGKFYFIRHMNTRSTRVQKICNLVFIMHFQASPIQNHYEPCQKCVHKVPPGKEYTV
jgi:hypothetical protein